MSTTMGHIIALMSTTLSQVPETSMRTENILCDVGGDLRGLRPSLHRCQICEKILSTVQAPDG